MRQRILKLLFLLFPFCLFAQVPPADQTEAGDIRRVKTLLVSLLDRGLPKVTLDFFLKYEAGGAPIKWKVTDCGERMGVLADDRSPLCVAADFSLKDGRAATVLLSVARLESGRREITEFYDGWVTYPGGTIHHFRQLSDLPAELHRPIPKGPRDLPPPINARIIPAP